MTSNIKELDPVQGLVDYIEDIKPYHSKVIEILTEYVYNEVIDTTITDSLLLEIGLIFPGEAALAESFAITCGFGSGPYDGFTAWPVITPNITLVLGPFADTPPGYDVAGNTVCIPGDRTNQYIIGLGIEIDLYAYDTVLDTRTVGVQTSYTIVDSQFVSFGQTNGVADTPYTILTVASLDDPAIVLPPLGGDEVYAAGVNLDGLPIDSVIGYSLASPVFYTDVPPGPDPLPTPTVGSLSQVPNENAGALIFSNSFIFLGNVASAFTQGFRFEVVGGSTAGFYTTKYAFYDSIGDKTYVRVLQEVDTIAFVTGDAEERFFGFDDICIDQTNIPSGLMSTDMLERLIFSWSDPFETDVIEGFQFFIQLSDSGSQTFSVNGDATDDVLDADTIQVIGSPSSDGVYTVASPPIYDGVQFTDIVVVEPVTVTLFLDRQDETQYSGVLPQGSFVGGDGPGGTAHAVDDRLTLSDGSTVDVQAVDGDGDVTEFYIVDASGAAVTLGVALTQSATTGTGLLFSITPELENVLGGGWVEKYVP